MNEITNLRSKMICWECVEEDYLQNQIRSTGIQSTCSYCQDSRRRCISIEELADQVDTAFEQHFTRTPDQDYDGIHRYGDWERDGEQVTDVIEQYTEIPQLAAQDIQLILEDLHSDFEMAQMGEECPFDGDSHYEEREVDSQHWHAAWNDLERTLRTESRFFSETVAEHLESIFDGIEQLSSWGSAPLIFEAGPGTQFETLYRARVFHSDKDLQNALSRPDLKLGPPPARLAGAGRMNARGISVFYGATNSDVCIAEVRPPVGSQVAVAAFTLLRPLRLLNLSALNTLSSPGSIFDPEWTDILARAAFIRTLCERMTRPVMPHDEDWEYLITQAIADFLATKRTPSFDGLVFPSVQAGNEHQNIVLFHKASRVKSLTVLDNAEVSAYTSSHEEEGYVRDYHVSVTPKATQNTTSNSFHPIPLLAHTSGPFFTGDEDPREDTLEIDVESIKIHVTQRVEYSCEEYDVTWYQQPE